MANLDPIIYNQVIQQAYDLATAINNLTTIPNNWSDQTQWPLIDNQTAPLQANIQKLDDPALNILFKGMIPLWNFWKSEAQELMQPIIPGELPAFGPSASDILTILTQLSDPYQAGYKGDLNAAQNCLNQINACYQTFTFSGHIDFAALSNCLNQLYTLNDSISAIFSSDNLAKYPSKIQADIANSKNLLNDFDSLTMATGNPTNIFTLPYACLFIDGPMSDAKNTANNLVNAISEAIPPPPSQMKKAA